MSIVGWLLGAAILAVAFALVYLLFVSPRRHSTREGHSLSSGQYRRVPSGKSPRVTTGQVNRVRTGQTPRVPTSETRRVATGQTSRVKTGQMRSIRTGEVRSVSGEYHAVSVVSDAPRCEAAQALVDIRFLSAAAPRLPLENCTIAATCTCRYRHYRDRRYHERRDVSLHGVELKTDYDGPERRSGKDRRAPG